ncbi:ABC transporter substrate-binding protein [Caldisphaera lagunensis]|uniref:ABC transporter substrate-binding protein n=1 Tax=Caldisphaera lagunensis TaxID=200415 RepID=UPI000A7C268B|nr:ABC transporter substrate-binding protein [Caldisphaera lagunensis]
MNKTLNRSVSGTTIAIIIVVIVIIIVGAVVGGYYATRKPTTTSTVSAPPYILIGTLYASTGSFATSSMSQYEGLQTWAKWVNESGGIYVKEYGKKIPVKIVAYDDLSSTSTAQSDYQQLLNVNHVNILVADFGSVLTAPAVSLTNASHILLWDVTGSSYAFFVNNPYIIDTSIPVSGAWVSVIAEFLHSLNISKVAVLYASNDFNAYQDYLLGTYFKQYGITPILNESYPTSTSDFSSYIATLESLKPQAVIEFGYPTDDIPFLNQLASSKASFPLIYTNYPGLQLPNLVSGVGGNMNGTFTGAFPPIVEYKVNYGPNLTQFASLFESTYPGVPINYNVLAGFNAGLIIQAAIQDAGTFTNQTALKQAVLNDISGKIVTLTGPFEITQNGEQLGETPAIAQIWIYPNMTTKLTIVWPSNLANGTAVYPEPPLP